MLQDYDVKQVAKMLGIDPLQLQLCQVEDEDDRNPVLPMTRLTAFGNVHPSQGLSRRMREVISNRKERPDTPMGSNHRSHQPVGIQSHRGHSSGSQTKGHSHRHHVAEEYQSLQHSVRTDRHRLEPGTNHRHLNNNNEHHYMRHGYNNNINGHSNVQNNDYALNDNAGASYMMDRRYEPHPAQGTSHPHRSAAGDRKSVV